MSIGQVLINRKMVTPQQLAEARSFMRSQGLRLDQALIQLGFITEDALLEVVSKHLSMPVVNLTDGPIERKAIDAMPARVVYRKRIVPVERENGTLRVEMSDPFDLY